MKDIVESLTDYLKYHASSYAVYETFTYGNFPQRTFENHFVNMKKSITPELSKFISLGNYVSIGKVLKPCRQHNIANNIGSPNFKDFQANDYNKIFGSDYVQIFDGQEILANPNNEYGLLLDYFGLNRSELEWAFNEEKGFYCLSYPVNYCLGQK